MNDDDAMQAGEPVETAYPHEVFQHLASRKRTQGYTPWGWFLAGWKARGAHSNEDAFWRFHADVGALLDMLPRDLSDSAGEQAERVLEEGENGG